MRRIINKLTYFLSGTVNFNAELHGFASLRNELQSDGVRIDASQFLVRTTAGVVWHQISHLKCEKIATAHFTNRLTNLHASYWARNCSSVWEIPCFRNYLQEFPLGCDSFGSE